MGKAETAVSLFREEFNCSQAILATFGPQNKLDCELALKIATPFGGGIARMGDLCGAVTGAIMVIGLSTGMGGDKDFSKKDRAYHLANQFIERFNEKNKSFRCRELTGCDWNTPEGKQSAKERDVINTICVKLVRDAAEILESMLDMQGAP